MAINAYAHALLWPLQKAGAGAGFIESGQQL